MDLDEIEKMPDGPEKALELAKNGLLFDGGHHKQWFLERILEALGCSLDEFRNELLQEEGYGGEWGFWDEGIPP